MVCAIFPFIISLLSLKSMLHPLHTATVRLQGKTNYIIQAYQDINNVIYNVEIEFKNIFSEAEQIAATVCLTPALPRIASQQAHRNNTPAATPEEYVRTTVGISLLDTIIMEIETLILYGRNEL